MDKKNTMLLTVIAVATLLVAVVGATFAFFSAQIGENADTPITVTTSTNDSLTFGSWAPIAITATQENFGAEDDDQVGTTGGTVSLTANADKDAKYCYKAELEITTNTFVYSGTNTTNAAELTISATKDGTAILENVDITTRKETLQIPTSKTGTPDYIHVLNATKGTTETDAWSVTVTLVNLNVDQQDNVSKSFVGALKYTKVDCPTASN